MDVLNLARCLGVEIDELLTSWRACSLLVVRSQARKKGVGSLSDAIRLVDRSSLVGSMVFLVHALEGVEESGGDTWSNN